MSAQPQYPENEIDSQALTSPTPLPVNQQVAAAKYKIEELAEELSATVVELEARVTTLEPEHLRLKNATDTLQHKTANLSEAKAFLDDKISGLEPAFRDLTGLVTYLEKEIQGQGAHGVKLESRLDAVEPLSQKLMASVSKLTDALNGITLTSGQHGARLDGLETTKQRLAVKTEELGKLTTQLEGITGKLNLVSDEHGLRLDGVEAAQQQFLEQSESLDIRTCRLEEERSKMAGEFKKANQYIYSALVSLLVAGTIVSLFLFNALSLDRESVQMKFDSVFEEFGQVNTQFNSLIQEREQITQLTQRLDALKQQLLKTDSVSLTMKSEHARVTGEIESLTSRLTALQGKLDAEVSGLKSIKVKVHNGDWVLKQDPNHFTIQLVGAYEKQNLFNYLRLNQNLFKRPVAYVTTTRDGRQWFTLQYGSYGSVEDAGKALKSLPQALRGNQPWVRSNKQLQAMMR